MVQDTRYKIQETITKQPAWLLYLDYWLFLCLHFRLPCCGTLGRSLTGEALIELINATGSVYGLGMACVKRVRSARNFDVVHGIFLVVIPLVRLCRCDGRGNKKTLPRCGVVEYHLPIVLRVNVLFHVERLYHIWHFLSTSSLPKVTRAGACVFGVSRVALSREPAGWQFATRTV